MKLDPDQEGAFRGEFRGDGFARHAKIILFDCPRPKRRRFIHWANDRRMLI
jgi:hypothetical protein